MGIFLVYIVNVEMTDKAVSPITERSAPAVQENRTDDLDNIPVEETIAPTKPPSAKRGFNVNKPEDKLNNNIKDDKTVTRNMKKFNFLIEIRCCPGKE